MIMIIVVYKNNKEIKPFKPFAFLFFKEKSLHPRYMCKTNTLFKGNIAKVNFTTKKIICFHD